MKAWLFLLFTPIITFAQITRIMPLIGQSTTAHSRECPDSLFYTPKTGNADTFVSVWQCNDETIVACNLNHPDSLNISTIESYFGARIPSSLGTFTLIAGRNAGENVARESINSDSLTIHGSIGFRNQFTKFFAQYQNNFFGRNLEMAITGMPVVKPGNNVDLAGSCFVLSHVNDRLDLFAYFGRNFSDETYSMQLTELLADNGWLHTSVGNEVIVDFRDFLILDRAKFGFTWSPFKSVWCDWVFENNRNITGANFTLDDSLNINDKSYGNTFDVFWSLSPWLNIATHLSQFHDDTRLSMSYRMGNGSYSSTFSSLALLTNDIAVSLKPSFEIAPGRVLAPFFSYRNGSVEVPGSPLIDLTQFLGIAYGSKRINVHAGTSIESAGLSFSGNLSCHRLECGVEFINNNVSGSLDSYDTWTEEKDSFALPIRSIKSLQIDLADKMTLFKNYSLSLYASQLLPFQIDYQNAKGEPAPSPAPNPPGHSASMTLVFLRMGIALQWDIPSVCRFPQGPGENQK
jgi:hypothetical protein